MSTTGTSLIEALAGAVDEVVGAMDSSERSGAEDLCYVLLAALRDILDATAEAMSAEH